MKKLLLQRLKETPYDQVENFTVGAASVYENIKKLGDDPTDLQTKVDAYARKVEAYLIAEKDAFKNGNANQLEREIFQVEERLRLAKKTCEDSLQACANLEKRLLSIAKEKSALEASLQALDEEEAKLRSNIINNLKSSFELLCQ